ncbi:OCIA domain-containing protein 1 isoform X2 [Drosophila sechellia]|uniref:GM15968 n=1 Tax=Drosophila sechellia TaxID=7238 RepID=B4I8D2_DROSE|nr:OCIA domain-containing protein 1 isoform X2 [Drosophila sechellia]EDW56857.1 GM15968 [Drosophila sechellia]
MDSQLNDGSQHPPPHAPHPLADYQFSAEEVKALRECNTESFFQRSLPFGTGLGLLAYFGVKNGYLQGHVKYGAVPKVVMGVILGYFVGKFSYQQKCAEKIMRLPNSHLGELLRQRRQGGGVISSITPDENLGRAFTLAPFSPSSADVYSDEAYQPGRSTALNLDTESRPTLSGLDDIYRPTLDSGSMLEAELPLEPSKPGQSYEDLRRRNREEYSKHQQSPYSRPYEPPVPVQQRPVEQTRSEPAGRKNQYGDSWTD